MTQIQLPELNPTEARIFRAVHIDNVAWILKHGMHCRSSRTQDPNFISIGRPDLIDNRADKPVPVSPGGMLADYVPFYFTPLSMMMYNIHTGYAGVTKRANEEIVIFVASLHELKSAGKTVIFTDQHACASGVEYFCDAKDLSHVDWPILQARDFMATEYDPGKTLRYQAEALVHGRVPLENLRGLVCYNTQAEQKLNAMIAASGNPFAVKVSPRWYF